jgi:hypothetical protein
MSVVHSVHLGSVEASVHPRPHRSTVHCLVGIASSQASKEICSRRAIERVASQDQFPLWVPYRAPGGAWGVPISAGS